MDNGAHFDGNQSGTVNRAHAASGAAPDRRSHRRQREYQVLARWDTPKVVKGVSFMLRLTVAADDGGERLVSTARDDGNHLPLPGNWRWGVHADGPGGECQGTAGRSGVGLVAGLPPRQRRRGLS
ncbi:hypothetical protein ACLK17_11230 [Escherichia coli]